MCTDTFLRLPEEKRNRFLEAAWEEFTSVPFEEASINKIVRRAKIPRGSFYQYFSGKEDLFFYLQGSMLEHCMEEYIKLLMQSGGNFYQTQLECFDRVIRQENPDPLFLRGMKILRLNPVFLMQAIIEKQLAPHIWETVLGYVDLSGFQEDEELAEQTFIMSLMALVMSLTDTMVRPQRATDYRQELLVRLNILKKGSLKQEAARGERI